MGLSQADNAVKIWRNLPISNPKPDFHNINAQNKFGEDFVIIRKRNTDGQTDRHTGETIIPRHYRVAGYKNITSKTNKRTKNTQTSFLFLKRADRYAKRTKHKEKGKN